MILSLDLIQRLVATALPKSVVSFLPTFFLFSLSLSLSALVSVSLSFSLLQSNKIKY